MRFYPAARTEAEKVFITVRNISGAAVSAGKGVDWDVVSATDGNSVTACKSGNIAGLFAGITAQALADSAYGEIQVYGFNSSVYVSGASAGSTPGTYLIPLTGGILTDTTLSAAVASGYTMLTLAETTATSAATAIGVFIRCM